MSPDRPTGLNQYALAGNDPVNLADPSGQDGAPPPPPSGVVPPPEQLEIVPDVNEDFNFIEPPPQPAKIVAPEPVLLPVLPPSPPVTPPLAPPLQFRDLLSARPAFVQLQINFFDIGPAFSFTLDRYGNFYGGLGGQIGKGLYRFGGALVGGWNKGDLDTSPERLPNFLTGCSESWTAGYWLGVGQDWTPSVGDAPVAGVMTPQVGWSITYSKLFVNTSIRW